MGPGEDFGSVHEGVLPERIGSEWGTLAAGQAERLPSLAFKLPDGRAWRYEVRDGSIALSESGEAETVVELAESDWQGLWTAREAVNGLVLSGRVKLAEGKVEDFLGWECALRVLYEQLRPYDPAAPLLGRGGVEIDPTRSFYPDDEPEEMADFLRVTGYVVVREVFSRAEVSVFTQAADVARRSAREDDGRSWWSEDVAGGRHLVRVLDGGKDPGLNALPADPRLRSIVSLSDFDLEPSANEGVSVLYKRAGMVFDGKADQPWHRDCGIGGHSLMCPVMNGSVFLRRADEGSGELRFLPGSWRTAGASIDFHDWRLGVGIQAAPGDFALHYGDGLHAGTPPAADSGPFRWSVVFEYGRIGRGPEQTQEHYDALMLDRDARSLHSS